MAKSYYTRISESADIGRYFAGPDTAGPWAAHLQHGGPPNALAVTAAERAVRAVTGRDDLLALRLAADFVGPVPVGEIETHARVIRAARSAALAEVVVSAGGRDCLHVRVWFVRDANTTTIATPTVAPVTVPADSNSLEIDFAYGASLDWRFVHGRLGSPGPAAAWIRPRIALLDGVDAFGLDTSGLARVTLIADSASGISSELDWSLWSFVNVDLDVHLARRFVGEWLLIDAATQLGPSGSALAGSKLSDQLGELGAGLQTLVLALLPS